VTSQNFANVDIILCCEGFEFGNNLIFLVKPFFCLRPDMAHLGMSRTVAPETLSPLMIGCLFVILYACVLYVVGYDGVN